MRLWFAANDPDGQCMPLWGLLCCRHGSSSGPREHLWKRTAASEPIWLHSQVAVVLGLLQRRFIDWIVCVCSLLAF